MSKIPDNGYDDNRQTRSLLTAFAGPDQADAIREEIAAQRRRDVILFRSAMFAVGESPRMGRLNAERVEF